MVSMQSIIDKYNPDEDNTFSNEDVLNIAKEIKESERKSLFNNKLLVAACALVAVVSVVDRSFARISNVNNVAGEPDAPPIRRLQEEVTSFNDWVECKAVATIPKFYVDTGAVATDGMAYVCEPTVTCEQQLATASPTVTATTATPTPEPTNAPTTSPTDVVTASPTSSSPTVTPNTGCFNSMNYGYKGDIEHSCEWVGRTEFRQTLLCTKFTEVRDACPVVCGVCPCEDNPAFTLETPFGTQDCDWIAANPLRKIGYCPVPDVGAYCAATCTTCGEYISMVPTMSGTSNETSAPTGRLDDD